MRLTTWGHSCVRFEQEGVAVLLDPGAYSDLTDAFDGVSAVLVTHEHPDHLDVAAVARYVRDSGATVHGTRGAVDALRDAGVQAERLRAVQPGDRLELGGLRALVTGGQHAEVHPDVPRIANVGYLVSGVLHPGDSVAVDVPAGEVRVLLAPVGGPWLRLADTVDLARALGPELVVPIHDAMLTDVGHALVDRVVSGLLHAGEYRRLALGEHLDLV